MIRQGLRKEILSIEAAAEVSEASTQEEALEFITSDPDLDLILLDLAMPGPAEDGIVSTICNQLPESSVIVISASENPTVITKTIDQGAAGFIPKSIAIEVMNSAIKLVLAGGTFIPKQMLNPTAVTPKVERASQSESPALRNLTRRQREVLHLLCQGASNQDIADELGIMMNTVKSHVQGILKTLKAENRTTAVIAANQLGLCEGKN